MRFIEILPKKLRFALEFREESWFNEETYRVLIARNINLVVSDSSRFPSATVMTSDFVYVRFHGPKSLYSSSYTRKELLEWSKKIKGFLRSFDVYCFFNNDNNAFAVENAFLLKDLIFA